METFATVVASILGTIVTVGVPAWILVRNHLLKERADSTELRAKDQNIDLDKRQKTHALEVQEQNDILEKMQELMTIERKNNEAAKQERAENYRKDTARLERRLDANDKKIQELEDKERKCTELAYKQQAEIDQLKQKNANQAQIIVELQEDIKVLQSMSHK